MNTGNPRMDARSRRRLIGVHPKLVRLLEMFAKSTDIQFIVTEGVRSLDHQKELVAKGASRTLDSKHLTGRAVDLAVVIGGEVRWDWPLYKRLADGIKMQAGQLGVRIVWGGDWRTFKDGPHFELHSGEA